MVWLRLIEFFVLKLGDSYMLAVYADVDDFNDGSRNTFSGVEYFVFAVSTPHTLILTFLYVITDLLQKVNK